MNIVIDNKFLKAFRVSRMKAQDVYLCISVSNALTGQTIIDQFIPEIALAPWSSKAGRVSLPSSRLMASVSLAKWVRSNNSAVLIRGNSLIPLLEGTYVVSIEFVLDGESKTFKPSLLHIGKTETEMVWNDKFIGAIFV